MSGYGGHVKLAITSRISIRGKRCSEELLKHDFILQNLNATNTFEKPKIFMGKVNKGRRIDYVLQG